MKSHHVAKTSENKQQTKTALEHQSAKSDLVPPHQLLQLQRLIGNQAVGRWLQAKRGTSRPGDERAPLDTILKLQRTIGNRGVGRWLQPKLSVGQPGDQYEKEADLVADEVVRMPEPENRRGLATFDEPQPIRIQRVSPGSHQDMHRQPEEKEEGEHEEEQDEGEVARSKISALQTSTMQRLCSECEKERSVLPLRGKGETLQQSFEAQPAYKAVQRQIDEEEEEGAEEPVVTQRSAEGPIQTSEDSETDVSLPSGGGAPLSEHVRSSMEPRFGYSFDNVRVHNDAASADSCRRLGAAAFTSGSNVYFGRGTYQPHSTEGKRLIAHELVHVVQQSKGRVNGTAGISETNGKSSTEANRGTREVRRKIDDGRESGLASSISPHASTSVQLAPNVTAVNGPAEVPAGRNGRFRLRATAPRRTAITWSIQGANPTGATLGASTRTTNNLVVPRTSTGGTITIRAADAANAADFADTNVTVVQVQQPTFVLAPVPAVILPAGAAFPANTVEASVCGNTANAAAVTVPAGRPAIRWSIVGNRRGATIDPATGVITPSVTQTGDIRVRATDGTLATARNEQTLTVRGHPKRIRRTIRTGTTAAAGAGTYGSVYDHIFQSSGGNLTGVNVSERVFNSSDPFNTGFAPVVPGLPNVWTLTAASRMVGDFMLTTSGNPGIDVNRFLPSPPNSGLPQVWTTPQILYWRSEQCGQWIPFENVAIQFILRRRRGGGFETVTINNGVAAPPEAYTGPALAAGGAPAASACPAGTAVSRVRFAPRRIAADGSALTTTSATARVRPGGSAVTWSFPGQNFGAAIAAQGNPALISAGNVAARVRVRATLTATPACFSEGWLTMQEPQVGPIRFSPSSVRTTQATRARVRTRPGARVVTWTIQGAPAAALGSAIVTNPDNSATITAGAQAGRITVRAADQRDATVFTEASLVIR